MFTAIGVEKAILSSVLFDASKVSFLQTLDEKDFTHVFTRSLFKTIIALEEENRPIDEELIKERMKKENSWDEEPFFEIMATAPIANIEQYVEVLKEKRAKRELYKLALFMQSKVEDCNLSEIQEIISKKIEEINKNRFEKEKSLEEIAKDFEEEIKKAQEKQDFIGYKSGIASLDRIIGAFAPGDLVVIGARPSMGKTAIATTITDYALKRGEKVLFDSLEMSATKLFRRLIATRSGESLSNLKRGMLQSYENYKNALYELKNSPLFIHDESYIPIEKLKAKAISKIIKHGIKYWFIDHLRYIKKKNTQNLHLEVAEITKELKKIAKEYGIVIFLLSQLNRDSNSRADNRPVLSDLRDSGAVEEDADIVLLLHRESYYKRGKIEKEPDKSAAEIIVAKNRDGATGVAKCIFNAPLARFEEECEIVYESPSQIDMPVL